ncbi:MAG: signal peptidase II [Verrucomicrobiales bacterium]
MVTSSLPLPGPRWLLRLASCLGFPATETIGLCLGHSIFLHPDWNHPTVLAHELVHTAQCERLGGLRPFLHRYLAECLAHGYAASPMECEARQFAASPLPSPLPVDPKRAATLEESASSSQPSLDHRPQPQPSTTHADTPTAPNAPFPVPTMRRWLLFLSLPLYILDQVTKWWTVARFDDPDAEGFQVGRFFGRTLNHDPSTADFHETIEVIPGFFWLHRLHNTGIAFGRFNGGAWSNYIFGSISLAAFIAITWMWRRNVFPTRLGKLAATLLLTGIVGNLTDRLVHGYVVDFLRFRLGETYARLSGDPFFPSFNVADSCITVAAVLLLLTSFQKPPPPTP